MGKAGSSHVVCGAHDRIFRDGMEAQSIEVFYLGLKVRNSFSGSAVRWQSGATCNCDFAPFDGHLDKPPSWWFFESASPAHVRTHLR